MKSTFPGKKIDDYVLTNIIGKGAFGEVCIFFLTI